MICQDFSKFWPAFEVTRLARKVQQGILKNAVTFHYSKSNMVAPARLFKKLFLVSTWVKFINLHSYQIQRKITLVRKEMDVNEQERLSNSIIGHTLKQRNISFIAVLHFTVTAYTLIFNHIGGVMVKSACLECCRSWVWISILSNQRIKLVFVDSPLLAHSIKEKEQRLVGSESG